MNSTFESARDSLRSSVSSPGIPKTYRTPSASRHSTNTSEALRAMISRYLTATSRREPASGARARTALACASLVGCLLVAPAARAASTFYITGAGNGHGIGMSQYGAYGYALHGWGYRHILGHYFQGTGLRTT